MAGASLSDAAKRAKRYFWFGAIASAVFSLGIAYPLPEAWSSGVIDAWSRMTGHRTLFASEPGSSFWFEFWLRFAGAAMFGLFALSCLSAALLLPAQQLEKASHALSLRKTEGPSPRIRKWKIVLMLVALFAALVLTIRSSGPSASGASRPSHRPLTSHVPERPLT